MSREWWLYLHDIHDAFTKIIAYSNGMTREEFLADSRTYDAVVRNLEVIGEAAKHIPPEVLESMPGVPWKRVASMRNILAHAYFGIDNDILRDVIVSHVPVMNREIRQMIDAHGNGAS